MALPFATRAADRRLLPEGRLAGPMPWVIAIMMFLMVLAAAGGLGLGAATRTLATNLSGRVTVQIIEADPARRERQVRAALAELGRLTGIRRVRAVDQAEMATLLEPYLGDLGSAGAGVADIPLPALIDVDLDPERAPRADAIADAVRQVAPGARVDDHGRFLTPLAGLLSSLRWLAAALVILMAAATAFTVVLAARSALNTHRPTIDVMHLLGATDPQIARLFQRRIALDALFGGLIGLGGAALVIFLVGRRISHVGSDLIGAVSLPPLAWLVLVLLPLAGMLLAMVAARLTVLSALRRIL